MKLLKCLIEQILFVQNEILHDELILIFQLNDEVNHGLVTEKIDEIFPQYVQQQEPMPKSVEIQILTLQMIYE